MKKIKTIFIGTPDFGIPALLSLINDNFFDVIAVISQPDKKAGRKQMLTEPPIKKIAASYGIAVFQPDKIKNFIKEIKELAPDLIVVVAYAQILPKELLALPRYGCVNVHGSLLPKYRGAACVQAAIINGDNKSGITIMKMDAGLDTGSIIAQEEVKINADETSDSLMNKLSSLSGKIVASTIKRFVNGEIKLMPQDNAMASKTKTLQKNDGIINWGDQAINIERFIRAMFSWPIAFTFFNKQRLQIIKTQANILPVNKYKIGEVFAMDKKIAVQCGHDAIILDIVKLEGKKELKAEDFIKGHNDFIGTILQAV